MLRSKEANRIFSRSLLVAFFNMNGLGIGYLYLLRWGRWLFHFGITVLLVVAAFVFTTVPSAVFWAGLGLWIGWMVWDGWRITHQMLKADPDYIPNLVFAGSVIGLVSLGLLAFGLWQFKLKEEETYAQANQAYKAANCPAANQLYQQFDGPYRLLSASSNLEVAHE